MSNILPQEKKEAIWAMYRARFIIAVSLVIIACAAFAVLALSPSYFVLAEANTSAPSAQTKQSTTTASDRIAIQHAQALIAALTPLNASSTPSVLIADALSKRPTGLQVTHITTTGGSPGTIILSGQAASIQEVNAYRNTLQADTNFSAVSVPLGDLAGTGDGSFSITLSANF